MGSPSVAENANEVRAELPAKASGGKKVIRKWTSKVRLKVGGLVVRR